MRTNPWPYLEHGCPFLWTVVESKSENCTVRHRGLFLTRYKNDPRRGSVGTVSLCSRKVPTLVVAWLEFSQLPWILAQREGKDTSVTHEETSTWHKYDINFHDNESLGFIKMNHITIMEKWHISGSRNCWQKLNVLVDFCSWWKFYIITFSVLISV